MERIFGSALTFLIILVAGYLLIGLVIMAVGMLVGLLVRPLLRLTSKVMALFGIQWTFRPYRRVLVLEEDVAYERREVWEGVADDWMDFSDEWLIGTVVAAVAWPILLIVFISWPLRRLVGAR